MPLDDLPTAELAARLTRAKHGVGDPMKNNQLFAACAKRLAQLDQPPVVVVPVVDPMADLMDPPARPAAPKRSKP